MSVKHYENFPVASWLCPAALRPAVAALYWYARTADDLADEGRRSPAQRLSDLAAYRRDLAATVAGQPVSQRWPHIFIPLGQALARHRWPVHLLEDLLSAFEQDVVKHRYVDRQDLLDYCRRSANPIGRLMLHLLNIDDEVSLRQSDNICTALQLINFWQDLGEDAQRGRLYIPLEDCARHRVPPASLLARHETPGTQPLVRDMVEWARRLMDEGAPLAQRVRGRFGWELRLVIQGGLRILEKIHRLDYATLHCRPVLHRLDAPILLWRALRMPRLTAP
ncbi:MAG: squalene synthase HpnC [Caldimonas sp.]|uniref:squalene synthase HpnC n=1 Tax=Caldimonas taiwanensis TaxID=307483 RepID=UPI000A034BE8|nr:squalene synthase HpnC [Caldimonas taiwanensis]GIX25050.1 MAG: squalene synthase HpnC [Caldimonas sp.]